VQIEVLVIYAEFPRAPRPHPYNISLPSDLFPQNLSAKIGLHYIFQAQKIPVTLWVNKYSSNLSLSLI